MTNIKSRITNKPFDAAERLRTIDACRFCPMCHHVDLAVTVTRRETLSPRGRGLVLFALEQGRLSWDAEVADVMYAFSADGLSRQVCAGHFDHDALILDARHRLVKAGKAPPALEAARKAAGETRDVSKAVSEGGGSPPGTPQVALFFGPSARPETVRALVKILRAAGVPFAHLASEGDPGSILYQLGDFEGAVEAARRVEKALGGLQPRTLVVLDAGAYRTLKAGLPALSAGEGPGWPGLEVAGPSTSLGAGWKVLHATESVAELLEAGRIKPRRLSGKVTYHDPCALARFTPVLEAPRKLLQALAGDGFVEMAACRELAPCCGAGGGLDLTRPDIAREGARRRLGQARAVWADVVSTGCGRCAATLAGAQDGPAAMRVADVVELVAEAL